jgi:hypothetical protein
MSDPNNKRTRVIANEKATGIACNVINGIGIVITAKNYVIGANGTGHWFQLREKYCFTGTVRRIVSCSECSPNGAQKLVTFYQVDINGEEFLIDKEYVVEYNQPIDNAVANKTIYENALSPEIYYPENNDYVKQTEKITGVKTKTTADYRDEVEGTDYKTIDKSVGQNNNEEV